MAIFRVNMRVTMAASIVSAAAVALILQHVSAGELFRALFFGFASADPELGAMMNGGGIASMLRVLSVCTTSGACTCSMAGRRCSTARWAASTAVATASRGHQ